MAEADACARRVERLRSLMAERGYDAAVLRNNAYDLARAANREGAGWNSSDTALLIRCAATWGYGWMGQIPLERF